MLAIFTGYSLRCVFLVSFIIGLQVLLFKKSCFVLGNNQQFAMVAISDDRSTIAKHLATNNRPNHNAALYHFFTHFFIPSKAYLCDGIWLYKLLTYMINHHVNESEFARLSIIDSDENLRRVYKQYSCKGKISQWISRMCYKLRLDR